MAKLICNVCTTHRSPYERAFAFHRQAMVQHVAESHKLFCNYETPPGWYNMSVEGPLETILNVAQDLWDLGIAGFDIEGSSRLDADLVYTSAVSGLRVRISGASARDPSTGGWAEDAETS